MIPRWYYTENGNRLGPFTFEELRDKRLTPTTPVWREGMKKEQPAGQVKELQLLFGKVPQKKRRRLGCWAIVIFMALLILLIILWWKQVITIGDPAVEPDPEPAATTAAASPGQDKKERPLTDRYHYELRDALLKKELAQPSEFLSVDYDVHQNVIGKKVVEGIIMNEADVATFHDIRLLVIFKDESKNQLGTFSHTISDYIHPGKELDFRIKTSAPKGTGFITVKIEGAKGAQEAE